MNEVFINYRTGDGDEAAALVDQNLSNRFGTERIFRAGKSIKPGDFYPESLLDAVRRSAVVLAVMGPDWTRFPQLREESDWVRQEILEAYAAAIPVIPVLKGRAASRLSAPDLPPALARLADAQSLRLDARDNQADLARIGDVLADLVPALKDADRSAAPIPGGVANSAGEVRGTVVQARDISGDAGTVIKGNRGTVHTGKGDINQGSVYLSGDGTTYITGDSDGGISHSFGVSRKGTDER